MLYRNLLVAVSLFACGTQAPAGTVELNPKVPTFAVTGVVDKATVPVGMELLKAADKGEKRAQLIIHSPGGSVLAGRIFLSMMDAARAKGMRITCFVPVMAASMAYQILLHCDERHALNNAFLLWHRARVLVGGGFFSSGVAITAPMARQLSEELYTTDDQSFSEILKTMNTVSPAVLAKHFEAETLHTALGVHMMAPTFITVHSYIPNLLEHPYLGIIQKEQSKATRKDKPEEEEEEQFLPGEIIYITDKLNVKGEVQK
jgi:ATP-dependent protease ClpP protease subunit